MTATKKKDWYSLIARGLVYTAATATALCFVFLVSYILIRGIPNITPDLFAFTYNSENVSLLPPLINTLIMVVLTLIISVPLGVATAIYLVEYAKKGNLFVKVIRMTTETLAGIPSIVYGLFGMLMFVSYLKWSYTLLGGALTLSIMVLPSIMRTAEEALLCVPDSFREGSFGLGAGKLRTILKIVLPSAMPGILAGVILAVGRIVGESAALMYTAGTTAAVPNGLFGSARTLAVHMYILSCEGLYMNQAFATAAVLLILVAGINWVAGFIGNHLTRK